MPKTHVSHVVSKQITTTTHPEQTWTHTEPLLPGPVLPGVYSPAHPPGAGGEQMAAEPHPGGGPLMDPGRVKDVAISSVCRVSGGFN